MSIRRWLIAHDFSPSADAAAQLALRDVMDGRSDTTLVMCHAFVVLPPPSVIEPGGFGEYASYVSDSTAQRLEQEVTKLRAAIDKIAQARPGSPVVEVEGKLRSGTPTEEMIAAARELDVERIYIGTHGRTGASHLFLGSVAERVARLATVPVVIVKSTEAT